MRGSWRSKNSTIDHGVLRGNRKYKKKKNVGAAGFTCRGQRDNMIFFSELELSMIHARILPAHIINVCPSEHKPDDVVAKDCEEFEERSQTEHYRL